MVFMWTTALWEAVPRAQVLVSTLRDAKDKFKDVAHPWRSASSPADVVLFTLRGIGWDFLGSARIVSDEGIVCNLLQLSPMQVRTLVRHGAVRGSDRRALALHNGPGGPPVFPVFWLGVSKMFKARSSTWGKQH